MLFSKLGSWSAASLKVSPMSGALYKRLPLKRTIRSGFSLHSILLWDRLRFEHVWGWVYRFEAYTPTAKRIRGYYALPLLWRDQVVGWANAAVVAGRLNVDVGSAEKQPREKAFRSALEAEFHRLAQFLESETGTLRMAR